MVSSVNLFGRLPEMDLKLSNGLSVLSVTSLEGDPDWTLYRRSEGSRTLSTFAPVSYAWMRLWLISGLEIERLTFYNVRLGVIRLCRSKRVPLTHELRDGRF